jgi:lysophospholipase L1-like esterase
MSTAVKIGLLFLFIFLLIKLVYMKGATKKKIIFFGDSITNEGMGNNGYITLIKNYMHDNAIEGLYLMGAGVNGNTGHDLRKRLEKSVLLNEPFATVVLIGINDIWQNGDAGKQEHQNQFEEDYRYIIQQLQVHNSKVLLCTPTVIGEKQHGQNERDADLDLYAGIVRKLAKEFNIPLVDLRQGFIEYYVMNNPTNLSTNILTTDGVHLNKKGNAMVAESIWKVLGTDTTINKQLNP